MPVTVTNPTPTPKGDIIWLPRVEGEIRRLVRAGWRRADAVAAAVETFARYAKYAPLPGETRGAVTP
jgi:hypothetical protein